MVAPLAHAKAIVSGRDLLAVRLPEVYDPHNLMPFQRSTLAALPWLCMSTIFLACRNQPAPIPTETLALVKKGDGEWTSDPKLSPGEVVYVRQRKQDTPDIVAVGRVPADTKSVTFEGYLQFNVEVPSANWICTRLGSPVVAATPCESSLRRIRLASGRLVAFIPCREDSCPLAIVHEGLVQQTSVAGLNALRSTAFGGVEAILAIRYWAKASDWTGSQLVVLQAAPQLRKLADIPLEEVDSRVPARVLNRLGKLQILPDALSYVGSQRWLDSATGQVRSSEEFAETWKMSAQGELVRVKN